MNWRLTKLKRGLLEFSQKYPAKVLPWELVEVQVQGEDELTINYQGQEMTEEAFYALPEIARTPRLVVVELRTGFINEQ